MLSENLVMLRNLKGLTQEQVAEVAEISRQSYAKWEQGLSVPDSGMLISLADALDTSVSILLGETVQEPSLSESEEVPREERQSVIYLLRYV